MTSEEIRCTFLAGFSVEAISYTKGRQKDWENVLDELAFIPVAYQRLQLDYQETYMRAFVDELVDLSVIFYHGGKPVGIWPVSLLCRDGVWQMGTNQGRVLPPLFVPALSERLLRKCGGACLDAMDRLHAELTKIMEFSEKWGGDRHPSCRRRFIRSFSSGRRSAWNAGRGRPWSTSSMSIFRCPKRKSISICANRIALCCMRERKFGM